MNRVSTSTDVKCEFCGDVLTRSQVVLFGEPRTVTCYGSCGCELSAERLAKFPPSTPMPQPSGHRCPICHSAMNLDGRNGIVSDCPWCGYSCVFRSEVEERNSELAAERRHGEGGVLDGTGVPPMYWNVQADHQAADRIIKGGRGLYIVGGNGTRKTVMAASVAKAFAERGACVRFASSVKLLSSFKDAYGQNRPEGEIFDELNGCDLLVIDDMGKENPTSWAATMLYAVIDGRYGSKKPIVVTTNYHEDELVSRLSGSLDASTARALISRLYEMTEKVELDGPDRRLGM